MHKSKINMSLLLKTSYLIDNQFNIDLDALLTEFTHIYKLSENNYKKNNSNHKLNYNKVCRKDDICNSAQVNVKRYIAESPSHEGMYFKIPYII